jgi:hypothetical protein
VTLVSTEIQLSLHLQWFQLNGLYTNSAFRNQALSIYKRELLKHFKLQGLTIPPTAPKDEPDTFELWIAIGILDLENKNTTESCHAM